MLRDDENGPGRLLYRALADGSAGYKLVARYRTSTPWTRWLLGRRFDGCVDLSCGEWQKLALARAYLRDAQILVLDEPTAALDARSEYEVFQRFAELTAGRTALLISHRFSTVRRADRIVVLADGRIAEQGPTASCWRSAVHTRRCSSCRRPVTAEREG